MYAAAPIQAADGSIRGIVYLAEPLPKGGLPGNFILQLGAALLAAAALALAAGTFLARRITRPVSDVITTAGRVSEGVLDRVVTVNSGINELDTLGGAFNSMVTSLKQSDRAQQAFVADVAHELRTPLTVIKGTIETLEDGAMDDLEGRGRLITSMQNETDRLIRLVNDLLVLTRADAGLLKLGIHPVDLADLARQRCEHFEPVAEKKNILFNIQVDGSPCVYGDEDRLAQVLDNLLDNALRYSPEDGHIQIKIHTGVAGERVCSIHNAGPGIPADHLTRIFDRFYRVENSRIKRGGEAGLGLAIVRSLLQAQGGSITAESQQDDGTTLIFRLPACPD
jgi:signal transduction histidine kinase